MEEASRRPAGPATGEQARSSRPLWLHAPGGLDDGVAAMLREARWEVRPTGAGHGPEAAGQGPSVGLAVFGQRECLQAPPQDWPAAGRETAWVVLVAPECLRAPAWRRFLADTAWDFHTLPVDATRLRVVLGHADGMARLRSELAPRPAGAEPEPFADLIAGSEVMRAVIDRARRYACTSLPLLVAGETGTGKDMLARAVHAASPGSEDSSFFRVRK